MSKSYYLYEGNQTFMKTLPELTVYLMNDQPMTCPKCGLRTLIVGDFFHTNFKSAIHQCGEDRYVFIEQVDEELE